MNSKPLFDIHILYQVAFSASLGSISFGYNLTVFNALRTFMQVNLFPEAPNWQITLMASLSTAGAALGSLYSAKSVNNIGRRNTLLLSDIIGIIGALLCMVESLPIIILGRTVQGFTTGINSVVVPLYNIEMSDLSVKGAIGVIHVTMLALGISLGLAAELFIPTGLDAVGSQAWRPIIGFMGLFHIMRIVIFHFYLNYETPLYLAIKDRIDESREVLKKFYYDDIDVEKQLQRVLKDKQAVTGTGNPTLKDMFTEKYKRAFFVSVFFMSGIQLSGFSPLFMFFSVFAGKSANNDPGTISVFATMMGIISLLTVMLSTVIVEKFQRRTLIVYGMLLITITDVLYILIALIGGLENGLLKYLFLIWPFFYRLSVGTLGFVYPAEVLPGIGVSFCLFSNWVLAFIVIQALMPIISLIGVEGIMCLFMLYCLSATIICHKYIIESKGRTKAELIELYRKQYHGEAYVEKSDLELSLINRTKK